MSSDSVVVVENATFPRYNNIQLDGRQFENIPAFFKELFLKEKQTSIWKEQITGDETLEDFVRNRFNRYSEEVSMQILEQGIVSKLKVFISEITEVIVEPIFQMRELNVDARVKFLESGNEINIEKKGDGTKRRITMALLEMKKEQFQPNEGEATIYLLDEPDTHLHVRAQLELMSTIEGFAEIGNQVILTTHSPFVVNVVKPSQIRLLLRKDGKTKNKSMGNDSIDSSDILQSLGIENTHLFFSRKVVIVEGSTEEIFLSNYYFKMKGRTLSSSLIQIINVDGISNIIGFSRAILELHDPKNIYIFFVIMMGLLS